jgi:hypothetical protein
MIEWKKYDKANLPELSKTFLLLSNDGNITTGELLYWTTGRYGWTRMPDETIILGVTHYAEINYPNP